MEVWDSGERKEEIWIMWLGRKEGEKGKKKKKKKDKGRGIGFWVFSS